MYRSIVCAIEASDEGRVVLTKAFELANVFGAKLSVVNVVPYQLLPKDYQDELKKQIIPKIESLTSEFGLTKKDVTIKFGKPYQVICNVAETKQADLILLGTHSKKGVQALIGSTATAVSNYATCDVSLIRI